MPKSKKRPKAVQAQRRRQQLRAWDAKVEAAGAELRQAAADLGYDPLAAPGTPEQRRYAALVHVMNGVSRSTADEFSAEALTLLAHEALVDIGRRIDRDQRSDLSQRS